MYLYFNYYFHFNTLLLQPRINSITNICIFYIFFGWIEGDTKTAAVENGFKKQLGTGKLPDKHAFAAQKNCPAILPDSMKKTASFCVCRCFIFDFYQLILLVRTALHTAPCADLRIKYFRVPFIFNDSPVAENISGAFFCLNPDDIMVLQFSLVFIPLVFHLVPTSIPAEICRLR